MLLAGLCTVDVVQRVAEIPDAGVKVQSETVALAAGGAGAHTD
ncbi:ribokinase, partial [Kutzneria sp. NPDC051319]